MLDRPVRPPPTPQDPSTLFQEVTAVTEIRPRQTEIRPRQADALTHQRDGLNVASSSDQLVHFPPVTNREPAPQSIVHPSIEPLGSIGWITKPPQQGSPLINAATGIKRSSRSCFRSADL